MRNYVSVASHLAERTASALLARPGALPRLLDIAAKSAELEAFSDALLAGLAGVSLPPAASLDEMRRMLQQARAVLPAPARIYLYECTVHAVSSPTPVHASVVSSSNAVACTAFHPIWSHAHASTCTGVHAQGCS
jgi:hypothetical protein